MDWYPRNPRHYRRKTRGLTLAAHGAYGLLIDEYMDTEEPIPDNDRALAAVRVERLGRDGCSQFKSEWIEAIPQRPDSYVGGDDEGSARRDNKELKRQLKNCRKISASRLRRLKALKS